MSPVYAFARVWGIRTPPQMCAVQFPTTFGLITLVGWGLYPITPGNPSPAPPRRSRPRRREFPVNDRTSADLAGHTFSTPPFARPLSP